MVLGSPGVKCTHNATMLPVSSSSRRISETGPLSEWSEEEVIQGEEWYGTHFNSEEVMQ